MGAAQLGPRLIRLIRLRERLPGWAGMRYSKSSNVLYGKHLLRN
jgi:hypothetical protein